MQAKSIQERHEDVALEHLRIATRQCKDICGVLVLEDKTDTVRKTLQERREYVESAVSKEHFNTSYSAASSVNKPHFQSVTSCLLTELGHALVAQWELICDFEVARQWLTFWKHCVDTGREQKVEVAFHWTDDDS